VQQVDLPPVVPASVGNPPPDASSHRGSIRPRTRLQDVPLSFAQQRLWFLDQLAPGNPFYVETAAFRIGAEIRPRALEMSLDAVVARHEVLRTRFVAVDGAPVQRIDSRARLPLEVVDLRASLPADRDASVAQIVHDRSTAPFDLTTCPLIRATLVRLSDSDHLMVIAMHHIVTDGWSMQVFGRELSTLYRCLVTGEPVDLPELPIQYADYAVWQRSDPRTAEIEHQLSYWRRRLHDLPVLDVPADRARPAVASYRGGDERFVIPTGVSERLAQFAGEEHATAFMVGFAAWAALLARSTDQTDIVVGVPVAGRDRPEVEHLIGCFLNDLVLRVDLGDDPSFRTVVARSRDALVEAIAHQDVPFERLVEDLQPARDLGRHPLFQIMFQHFDTGGENDGAHVAVRRTTAIVDLFLHLWDEGGTVRGKIEYASDLFDAETVRPMAHRFVVFLRAALSMPDQPVSRVPIGTRADLAEVADMARGPEAADEPLTIAELWDRQVDHTPDAVALVEDDRRHTYRRLNDRVRAIRAALAAAGVGPATVVGICLDRSADAIAAQLAVVSVGAAWVALDPSYPQHVLDHVVTDSGAVMVLTDREHAGWAEGGRAAVALLDELPADVPRVHRDAASRPRPDDLACLIYTSGSTGRPKGVMAEHRGIHNRLAWMWRTHPFEPGEVLALKTAPSFVDSIWETFGPLLAGVPSVIVSGDDARDPSRLVDILARHGVTRLLVVPSLLRAILDSGREIGLELPRLRRWYSSGEVLPPTLAARFAEFVPDGELFNLYGSSEIAGDVTAGRVEPSSRSSSVTIGRPIDNTQIHILGPDGSPVPVGVPGRIYAAGANVARGYHARPSLTAASFVPDPFSSAAGARMYDTGDRGRWRRDGTIEFLGRRDHQVKVRGLRVELGHVERALADHPDVRQVAVVRSDRSDAGGHLVAFVAGDVDASDLRAHAGAHLTDVMVPALFVVLDELPLTPNGKVDRTALAGRDTTAVSDSAFVEPATDAERRMAESWSELLAIDRIGAEDHFFDLGGHSLLATRLVSAVRRRFGVEMPLAMVFERPTLRDLAAGLETLVMAQIDELSDEDLQRELET
jgi:amino acid adenylation domain-containing protein